MDELTFVLEVLREGVQGVLNTTTDELDKRDDSIKVVIASIREEMMEFANKKIKLLNWWGYELKWRNSISS